MLLIYKILLEETENSSVQSLRNTHQGKSPHLVTRMSAFVQNTSNLVPVPQIPVPDQNSTCSNLNTQQLHSLADHAVRKPEHTLPRAC